MSIRIDQTAILVFSRTAAYEAAVKVFDPTAGRKANTEIARRLIRRTLATAHRTHLPVFLHTTRPSTTGTFGEKLADALESVFRKGYEKVIVIGNDSPDLSTDLLLDAQQRLEENQLVLGPCTDGGVYLIGINQAYYQRRAFVALAWESERLQGSWKKYGRCTQTAIDWLTPLSDIDRATDFKALLQRLPVWHILRRQLLSILASSAGPLIAAQPLLNAATSSRTAPLRGPPNF